MIARLTAAQLRELADLVEDLPGGAFAHLVRPNTVLEVDGLPVAYAYWWQDGDQFMAEFISFTPGDARPLIWHDRYDGVGASAVHGGGG